jgi:hypothetical protein
MITVPVQKVFESGTLSYQQICDIADATGLFWEFNSRNGINVLDIETTRFLFQETPNGYKLIS